jgi:serine/threonine-protein kinase
MSKQKNKPWDEKWETIKSIGGGGQGDTFLVKPKDSTNLSQTFILKKLKIRKILKDARECTERLLR